MKQKQPKKKAKLNKDYVHNFGDKVQKKYKMQRKANK